MEFPAGLHQEAQDMILAITARTPITRNDRKKVVVSKAIRATASGSVKSSIEQQTNNELKDSNKNVTGERPRVPMVRRVAPCQDPGQSLPAQGPGREPLVSSRPVPQPPRTPGVSPAEATRRAAGAARVMVLSAAPRPL